MMQPAMVPEEILEERRQLGHDRFDEVWEGVLHMVPFPTVWHQRNVGDLNAAMRVIAGRRGLEAFTQTGLYDPAVPGHTSYRGPDIVVVDPAHLSNRGIEGRAELVIEVLSPNDERRDKLPFYARVGVREVWLLDPLARTIEVFGGETLVEPVSGKVQSRALGLEVWIDGNTLRIRDDADMYEVPLGDAA